MFEATSDFCFEHKAIAARAIFDQILVNEFDRHLTIQFTLRGAVDGSGVEEVIAEPTREGTRDRALAGRRRAVDRDHRNVVDRRSRHGEQRFEIVRKGLGDALRVEDANRLRRL